MALPASGTITLDEVANEFEDAAPHMMSEFYSADDGVPSSGTISMSNMHGKQKKYIADLTISANTTNYNLRTQVLNAGWDGVEPVKATLTINSGQTVYATSTGGYALTINGSWPAGSEIHIINNGTILGKGGNGGAGGYYTSSGGKSPTYTAHAGTAGTAAGPALYCDVGGGVVSITNNGRIAGGGGGGGGGAPYAQGAKGTTYHNGGGGGGGIGNGSGGSGAPNGGAGSLSSVGAGGISTHNNGGNGGSWGSAGVVGWYGGTAGGGYSGGAAGKAVQGNSNITWLVNGTRNGALSG